MQRWLSIVSAGVLVGWGCRLTPEPPPVPTAPDRAWVEISSRAPASISGVVNTVSTPRYEPSLKLTGRPSLADWKKIRNEWCLCYATALVEAARIEHVELDQPWSAGSKSADACGFLLDDGGLVPIAGFWDAIPPPPGEINISQPD